MEDTTEFNKAKNCRMYRNEYPEEDDLVVCKILTLGDEGSEVELLEYNNIKGFLSISQFTRRRTRSIKKIANVGQEHVLQVLGSDSKKGYVDLSKKNVMQDEIQRAKDKYMEAKKTHHLLARVAQINDMDLLDLYENCGWKLCEHFDKSMYDLFEMISDIDGKVFIECPCEDVSEKVRNDLLEIVEKTFVKTEKKYEKEFQLMSTAENGIDVLKICLLDAKTLDNGVEVEIIGAPNYRLAVNAHKDSQAEDLFEETLQHMQKFIEEHHKETTQLAWEKVRSQKKSESEESDSESE